MKTLRLGEGALLVRGLTQARLRSLCASLSGHRGLALHPAYESLLIEFDPLALTLIEIESLIARSAGIEVPDSGGRTIEIPVVYDGPDLDEVAQETGLTREAVVALHSGASYTAAFLGFQPGFAYLAGLPRELVVRRLATPRVRVPAGSVGIAGVQSGIYPIAMSGGWRLIGRTHLRMFMPENETSPTLIRAGYRVRFVSVEKLS